jgi:hypothetical protein
LGHPCKRIPSLLCPCSEKEEVELDEGDETYGKEQGTLEGVLVVLRVVLRVKEKRKELK